MVPVSGVTIHYRAVCPVSRGDGRDAIADAWAVLSNHHPMTSAGAGVAIGHMGSALLMHHRDQSNTCWREDVHGVHKGRTHDAKQRVDTLRHHGFDKSLRGGHFLRATDNSARCNGLGSVHAEISIH